jgi:hypothetical protein
MRQRAQTKRTIFFKEIQSSFIGARAVMCCVGMMPEPKPVNDNVPPGDGFEAPPTASSFSNANAAWGLVLARRRAEQWRQSTSTSPPTSEISPQLPV